MIQFSHVASREENLPQRTRCRYFRETIELGSSKRHPESVTNSRGQLDRGQAMPCSSGGASPHIYQRKMYYCVVRAQRTSWCKPMFDAMSPPDVTDELSLSRTPDVSKERPSDRDLQRADGCGRIVLSASENGTRIEDVFERSPIRIMFPRTEHRAVQEAVLINTAGGIAGGDQLEWSVTALPQASIAVTSQAAEKVYRALYEPAHVVTRLRVEESAKLAWLPQETIVFNWARLHRTTEIYLSSGAELLALEWLMLGRTAHGEVVVGGNISDSWRVKKDDRLIWADSFRITDEIFSQVTRKALLANCRAVATLIYFGPYLEKRLDFLREIIPSLGCNCAATLVGGLIVVRFATQESFDLKLALRSFLQQFGPELGSGPFQVPKIWAC
jgi:urease accessory protein